MEKENLLIIDDDKRQLEYLNQIFKNDFNCCLFSNSIEAFESLLSSKYVGVLTDLHMPVLNGIEIVKKIRLELNLNMPIWIFSNDVTVESKIKCLELKVSDYLNSEMCEAEIRLRIINFTGQNEGKRQLIFENLILDTELLSIYVDHKLVDLTQIEYKLIYYILKNNGSLQKKKLMSFIWPNMITLDKTLNTHLTNLRIKLKEHYLTIVTGKDDFIFLKKIENQSF